MSIFTRRRVIVACSVVLLPLCIFMGWKLLRSHSAPAVPDSVPAEFRPARARFDHDAGTLGADAVAQVVAERARVLLDSHATDLSLTDRQTLVAMIFDHTAHVLSPTIDSQRSLAQSFGTMPSGSDPASPSHPDFLRKFAAAADTLRGVVVSSQDMDVRLVRGYREPAITVPMSMFLRSGNPDGASVRYGDPPKNDPSVVVVEVYLPAHARAYKTKQLVPVTIMMRFWKNTLHPEWRPADLCMYFGPEGFGHAWLPVLY